MPVEESNRPPRGRLIVLEGPDGVGKTTVARALREKLLARMAPPIVGEPMVVTASSGATSWAREVNGAIHDRTGAHAAIDVGGPDPLAFQLGAAAAARDGYARRIGPWLNAGRDVICDRIHAVSALLYGAGVDPDTLMRLIALARPPADARWFVLRAPWGVLEARKNYGDDVWERRGRDFLALVAGAYASLDGSGGDFERRIRDATGWGPAVPIDATAAPGEVADAILARLDGD